MIKADYYRSDRSIFAHQTNPVTIQPHWNSAWSSLGWGWSNPGNWPVGAYKLVLSVDDQQIAAGSFEIIESANSASRSQVLIVTNEGTYRIRSGPSLSAGVLGSIKVRKGDTLNALETTDDWYKVGVRISGNYVTGWLTKSITVSESNSPPSHLDANLLVHAYFTDVIIPNDIHLTNNNIPPRFEEFYEDRTQAIGFFLALKQTGQGNVFKIATRWFDETGAVRKTATSLLPETKVAWTWGIHKFGMSELAPYPGKWTVVAAVNDNPAGEYKFRLIGSQNNQRSAKTPSRTKEVASLTVISYALVAEGYHELDVGLNGKDVSISGIVQSTEDVTRIRDIVRSLPGIATVDTSAVKVRTLNTPPSTSESKASGGSIAPDPKDWNR